MGRRSGGLLLLIRKQLEPFVERITLPYDYIVGVKLSKELIKSNGDVILIGAYVPPKGSPSMGTWTQIVTYQFRKTVCWIFQSNTPGHT